MTSELLTEEIAQPTELTQQASGAMQESTDTPSTEAHEEQIPERGEYSSSIYGQIAARTGGNLYLGVVGPVRSGKSTFIRKFMQTVVVPNIEDEYERARATDQIPQSGTGRTIMTTEPKFVPDEAVCVSIGENARLSMRMIDCVGYPVEGALGTEEDGTDRLVKTPWREEEIPFRDAARIGTQKVIREHSTVGILMTTDGSFTGIARESYAAVEEEAAREMLSLGIPFAIVLNVKEPAREDARELALSLEKKYGVAVALVSALALNREDIEGILTLILKEFPLKRISVSVPPFLKLLPKGHRMLAEAKEKIMSFARALKKFADIEALGNEGPLIHTGSNPTDGSACFALSIPKENYYDCISELSGMTVSSEEDIVYAMSDYARIKKQYERLEYAWARVNDGGYGIVMPSPQELEFEEPGLMKTASGYGVKLSAKADCIHMIRTSIRTELSPVVGTEEQAEEVIRYLMGEFMEGKERVWQSNMFGKSLYDLVKDSLQGKLEHLPDESRAKLQETLERIINEGANGLICILL